MDTIFFHDDVSCWNKLRAANTREPSVILKKLINGVYLKERIILVITERFEVTEHCNARVP